MLNQQYLENLDIDTCLVFNSTWNFKTLFKKSYIYFFFILRLLDQMTCHDNLNYFNVIYLPFILENTRSQQFKMLFNLKLKYLDTHLTPPDIFAFEERRFVWKSVAFETWKNLHVPFMHRFFM